MRYTSDPSAANRCRSCVLALLLALASPAWAATISVLEVRGGIAVDAYAKASVDSAGTHEAQDDGFDGLSYDRTLSVSTFDSDSEYGSAVQADSASSLTASVGPTLVEVSGGSSGSVVNFCGEAPECRSGAEGTGLFVLKFTVDEDVAYDLTLSGSSDTWPLDIVFGAIPDPNGPYVEITGIHTNAGLSSHTTGNLAAYAIYVLQASWRSGCYREGSNMQSCSSAAALAFELMQDDDGGGGSEVPLPGSGWLAATAIAALAGRYRRKPESGRTGRLPPQDLWAAYHFDKTGGCHE